MGATDTLINGSITVPTVGHRCQVCPKLAFGLSVHRPTRDCNNALTLAAYPQPTPNTVASSPKFRNSTLKRQRTIVCLGAKGVGMQFLLVPVLGGVMFSHKLAMSCRGSTLSQGSLRRCNNTVEKSFLRVCIHAPPALSISLSTIGLNWSSLLDLALFTSLFICLTTCNTPSLPPPPAQSNLHSIHAHH